MADKKTYAEYTCKCEIAGTCSAEFLTHFGRYVSFRGGTNVDTHLYEFSNVKIIVQRHFDKAKIAELTKEFILESMRETRPVPPKKSESSQ